jgi:hypothetical protein
MEKRGVTHVMRKISIHDNDEITSAKIQSMNIRCPINSEAWYRTDIEISP